MRRAIAFTSATVLGGIATFAGPVGAIIGCGGYMN